MYSFLFYHFLVIFNFAQPIKSEAVFVESLNETVISYDTNYAIIRYKRSIHRMFGDSLKKTNLSHTELEVLDSLLKLGIDKHNFFILKDSLDRKDDRRIDLDSYKKQLIPVINKIGEKEVFVNCICFEDIPALLKSGINWKKDTFKMNDGGKCYFHLFINLTKNEIYGFRVYRHI